MNTRKKITSMLAALAVLSGATSAVALAANGPEKENADAKPGIVVETETDAEDTPVVEEDSEETPDEDVTDEDKTEEDSEETTEDTEEEDTEKPVKPENK